MGGKLLRRKFSIAVLIEAEQRFRSGLEFLGGKRAVLVGIERDDHWRWWKRRALSLRRALGVAFLRRTLGFAAFWVLASLGWRRHQFLTGDLAVSVAIKFRECFGCVPDFPGGDRAIMVSVENHEDRWSRWRRALSLGFLGGSSAGQQGDAEVNGGGFHGLIGLDRAWFRFSW